MTPSATGCKTRSRVSNALGVLRSHTQLAAFAISYYVVLIAYGLVRQNPQAPFYALFIALAAGIVVRLDRTQAFSSFVLWGLSAWGFMHMVGGLIEIDGEVIYEHSLALDQLRFDKFVHFFGFGFATLAAHERLTAMLGDGRRIRLAAFLVGLGIGAINETVEFLVTLLPGESNVGGFSNTGWDLVANALGAAAAVAVAPVVAHRGDSA